LEKALVVLEVLQGLEATPRAGAEVVLVDKLGYFLLQPLLTGGSAMRPLEVTVGNTAAAAVAQIIITLITIEVAMVV